MNGSVRSIIVQIVVYTMFRKLFISARSSAHSENLCTSRELPVALSISDYHHAESFMAYVVLVYPG